MLRTLLNPTPESPMYQMKGRNAALDTRTASKPDVDPTERAKQYIKALRPFYDGNPAYKQVEPKRKD